MIAYQGLHHFHNEKSMYTEPNDICDKSKQLSRVFRGFRIGTSRWSKSKVVITTRLFGLVSRQSDSSLGCVSGGPQIEIEIFRSDSDTDTSHK